MNASELFYRKSDQYHTTRLVSLKQTSQPYSLQEKINSQDDVITELWNSENKKRKLTNQKICCLNSLELTQEKTEISFFPIDYKTYLADREKQLTLELIPIAVSALVFYQGSSNLFFLSGKRSKYVTHYPESYEWIGSGTVDLENFTNFHQQLKDELREEANILDQHIVDLSTFCCIYDSIEKLIDIGVKVQLKDRINITLNPNEYASYEWIPKSMVKDQLLQNQFLPTSKYLFELSQGENIL